MTFWNSKQGGLDLVKVNESDRFERIPNSIFEICRAKDDALVDTVNTNQNGHVFVPLPKGSYYAEETKAGKNFALDDTQVYFEVKDGAITYKEMSN